MPFLSCSTAINSLKVCSWNEAFLKAEKMPENRRSLQDFFFPPCKRCITQMSFLNVIKYPVIPIGNSWVQRAMSSHHTAAVAFSVGFEAAAHCSHRLHASFCQHLPSPRLQAEGRGSRSLLLPSEPDLDASPCVAPLGISRAQAFGFEPLL